jgi:hypothetical protein
MILLLYAIVLLAMGVYSYWLIDPNITFFQNNYWVMFRDWAVYLGYYRRDISWIVYLILHILLFVFHFILTRNYKKHSPLKIAGFIALLGCVAYPFVSHDLFNYLFDARILTYYGLNPYTHTALDFQKDLWTRFMHWTHRTYPYGPTFLPLTLVPSFLGLGKFSLTFFLYKAMNGALYFLAVYLLNKKNIKDALFFSTHPLIIVEGLFNAHNDMMAVSIGLIGIYLLEKKYSIWGRIILFISAGIKYVTAPILFLSTSAKGSRFIRYLFLGQIALVLYLCIKMEIQPWYFLSLFVFLPFFPQVLEKLHILFFGLLLSYYPFIRFGDWTAAKVVQKREIIYVSLIIQIIYLIWIYLSKKKQIKLI